MKLSAAALTGMLLLMATLASAAPAPQAHVAQGEIVGTTQSGIDVFRGIPFAAPPVGNLRWRPPQPAAAWTGIRPTAKFGPICPQATQSRLAAFRQSENCLTLNVWTAGLHPASPRPVMVWIYGGGFVEGGSALPYYDGRELARRGVVVVSFNYRLGWLGFLDEPALARPGEPTGNYGLLDQIAALKWVHDNIAAFGGDPSEVTIFGESAGGMSVNDLMASPLARGLFVRAISESGLGLVPLPSAAAAQRSANGFLAREHIAGHGARAMAALRRLPLQDILADQKGKPFDETPAPMVDGMVMTEQPAQAFAQGNIAPAAYLAGSNSNEASLLPATGLSTAAVLERAGADLPKLRKLYETHGVFGDNALADALFDDRAFAAGAQGLALYAARLGHAAFVYYFTYVPQNLRHQVHGVAHGYEIPFVFGNAGYGRYPKLAARIARNTTAQDRQLRKMVQRYWTNFAKTGDPNAEGLPQWPATRPGDHATLVIGVHTHAVHGFHRARLAAAFAAFTAQSHLNLPH